MAQYNCENIKIHRQFSWTASFIHLCGHVTLAHKLNPSQIKKLNLCKKRIPQCYLE